MSSTVIKVEHVGKMYKLYETPLDRLKESLGVSKKKRYKEHYALNDVSFEVKRGETVGIIGTNGAGKSTILKIITGVLTPTVGAVEIEGRISALLELGAGFNMEYTGIENIYLNGTMRGYSKEEVDQKIDTILEFADIGEFVNQPVKTYSSGMFVRLAFAIAINIDPEILIVDEALSVGDIFFQAKCFHKFEEFKQKGKTILFVSHELSSIQRYCDKVILLDKGRKIAEDKPKVIIDLYKKMIANTRQTDPAEYNGEMSIEGGTEGKLWKTFFQNNPDYIEYGDKDAEIIDFAVLDDELRYNNVIESGHFFSVKMKIKFWKEIKEPIFAFTIKNVQGLEIVGTNTLYENMHIDKCEPGEIKEVEFSQEVALRPGEYLISLGCTGYREGEFVVYHRLYDIISLNIISERQMVGFVDMQSVVTVN